MLKVSWEDCYAQFISFTTYICRHPCFLTFMKIYTCIVLLENKYKINCVEYVYKFTYYVKFTKKFCITYKCTVQWI